MALDYGHYEFLFGLDAQEELWLPINEALGQFTELDMKSDPGAPEPTAAPDPASAPEGGPEAAPVRGCVKLSSCRRLAHHAWGPRCSGTRARRRGPQLSREVEDRRHSHRSHNGDSPAGCLCDFRAEEVQLLAQMPQKLCGGYGGVRTSHEPAVGGRTLGAAAGARLS
eukprot:scaffold6279_cov418-Prasinococcus_capsulatus_cf.AAC.4